MGQVELDIIPKKDYAMNCDMQNHYSKPQGFVGRSICYAIYCKGIRYGSIVGGSAGMNLDGRDRYFAIAKQLKGEQLKSIVNNIFFHVEPFRDKYPIRNFTVQVLREWRRLIQVDWFNKYNDKVYGFESLVELPRTGNIYLRDGWEQVGITKGFTCKRVAGRSTDNYTGKREWNTQDLKPRLVFCKFA